MKYVFCRPGHLQKTAPMDLHFPLPRPLSDLSDLCGSPRSWFANGGLIPRQWRPGPPSACRRESRPSPGDWACDRAWLETNFGLRPRASNCRCPPTFAPLWKTSGHQWAQRSQSCCHFFIHSGPPSRSTTWPAAARGMPRARVGGQRSEVRCGSSNGRGLADVWPATARE